MTPAELVPLATARESRMTATESAFLTWMLDPSWEQRLRASVDVLWEQSPNIGGFLVAWAAVQNNRISLAVEAAETVDYADPCWRRSPLLWTARVDAHHLATDYEEELGHALEARRRFPADPYFVQSEARARAGLGQLEDLSVMVDLFYELPTNDRVIYNLRHLAYELEVHGYEGLARDLHRQGHEFGLSRAGVSTYDRTFGAYNVLPPAEALPILEAAREELPNDGDIRAALAFVLQRLGRLEEARVLEEVMLGSPRNVQPALLAAERGETRLAVDRLIAAFEAGRGYYTVGGLFLHYSPTVIPLLDDPAFQAVMRPRN